jgi:aryl-alcohol dehydrogenase-like predicted oxidoreductase
MLTAPWGECHTLTGPDHAVDRKYLAEISLPLLNWSALAGGFLSGRFQRADADDPEKRRSIPIRCYASEDNWTRLDRAGELAERLGLSVPQVAVGWCLCSGLNAFPLTASWTTEEAASNAAAGDVELSAEECAWLNLETDERPF